MAKGQPAMAKGPPALCKRQRRGCGRQRSNAARSDRAARPRGGSSGFAAPRRRRLDGQEILPLRQQRDGPRGDSPGGEMILAVDELERRLVERGQVGELVVRVDQPDARRAGRW